MSLYEFDENIRSQTGCRVICGVDEAGRGPLAGPVFAAAVILPEECVLDGLNDSKKLSEKKRDRLFAAIMECCSAFSIAQSSQSEIDDINILQASLLAMSRAVEGLSVKPDYVLADGIFVPTLTVPARAVTKGDASSAAIAAASILAKVARDRFMCDLDRLYPQYGFARHKGYPTKLHYRMLEEYGPSPVHRKSFLRKLAPA